MAQALAGGYHQAFEPAVDACLSMIDTLRSRKALLMTLTDDSAMAAAAITGDRRMPKVG
jgi:hypothetical protein